MKMVANICTLGVQKFKGHPKRGGRGSSFPTLTDGTFQSYLFGRCGKEHARKKKRVLFVSAGQRHRVHVTTYFWRLNVGKAELWFGCTCCISPLLHFVRGGHLCVSLQAFFLCVHTLYLKESCDRSKLVLEVEGAGQAKLNAQSYFLVFIKYQMWNGEKLGSDKMWQSFLLCTNVKFTQAIEIVFNPTQRQEYHFYLFAKIYFFFWEWIVFTFWTVCLAVLWNQSEDHGRLIFTVFQVVPGTWTTKSQNSASGDEKWTHVLTVQSVNGHFFCFCCFFRRLFYCFLAFVELLLVQ